MSLEVLSMVIFFAPLVLVILFVFGFTYAVDKNVVTTNLPKYDERQRTIRYRAAMHALAFVMIYLVVWALLDLFSVFSWTNEIFVFAMTGVVLAYGIWKGECLLRFATLGWSIGSKNEGPYSSMLCSLGMLLAIFKRMEIRIVAVVLMITGLTLMLLHLYATYRWKKAEKLAETEDPCEEVDVS